MRTFTNLDEEIKVGMPIFLIEEYYKRVIQKEMIKNVNDSGMIENNMLISTAFSREQILKIKDMCRLLECNERMLLPILIDTFYPFLLENYLKVVNEDVLNKRMEVLENEWVFD